MKASMLTGVVLAAAAAAITGCVPRATMAAAEPGVEVLDGMCPTDLPGATVTAEEVEGGAALVFTTRAGDVAALRDEVREMADMNNQNRLDGKPMGRGTGGLVPGGMMIPATTASAEDIEGGARLVFEPKDISQVEAIRDQARVRAARMATGECPTTELAS